MTQAPPAYVAGASIDIPEQGNWPASVHVLQPDTIAALRAAEATGRPLLIRGAPGVGKSETARAAASFRDRPRPFLSMVIDGRTEPDDLKWRVDALARLSDAQGGRGEGRGVKEELAYVRPQVLWWAYEWTGAQAHHDKYQLPKPEVHVPPNWNANADRCVVLLDEIDKADPDLPNALLDVLANKGFIPPFAGAKTVRCTQATRPLILITTNEERELPAAFLRRCLVHTLTLPEGKKLEAYLSELAERHQAHRVARLPEQQCHIIPEVAAHFMLLHEEAKQTDDYVPGTSEFLDLVQALAVLYPGRSPVARQPQLDALEQLAMFVRKSALTDR